MKTSILTLTVIAFAASALLTGCQDNSKSSDNQTTNDSSSASNTNQTVGSNVDQTLNAVSNGARNFVGQATNGLSGQVDNSKINQRDRDTNNLTPLDQGNSDSDRAISASIRKMVVSSTNAYSMTAKNVKIITKEGRVTLRGPVKTDDEKSGIEAIAKSVAGDGNVDNQLEVNSK